MSQHVISCRKVAAFQQCKLPSLYYFIVNTLELIRGICLFRNRRMKALTPVTRFSSSNSCFYSVALSPFASLSVAGPSGDNITAYAGPTGSQNCSLMHNSCRVSSDAHQMVSPAVLPAVEPPISTSTTPSIRLRGLLLYLYKGRS
jgi:hypothetical protein